MSLPWHSFITTSGKQLHNKCCKSSKQKVNNYDMIGLEKNVSNQTQRGHLMLA